MRRMLPTLLISLLVVSTEAVSQDEAAVNPLAPGVQSLSFGIPGSSSGEFGYWRTVSERSNLGWAISLAGAYAHQEVRSGSAPDLEATRTTFSATMGPQFRR